MPFTPFALLVGLTATAPVLPAGDVAPVEVDTPHARMLHQHRHVPPSPRTYPAPGAVPRSLAQKTVYGYLPYWVSDTTQIRWELLSHVAHFSLEMTSEGTLSATHGWPDADLVFTAHQAGVKAEVVVALFNSSALSAFLSSPTRRATGIKNMIDAMEAGGADGVSIDFEGVPGSQRANLVTFFAELRAALDARGHADAGITVAAPAVDWSDAWDVGAILDHVDVYFVMAYDFFWSGSGVAGPSGIFRTDATWRPATGWSTLRSIATVAKRGGESKRGRVVAGVPYYGYEYRTASDTWPSSTTDFVGSMTYKAARNAIAEGTPRVFDEGICQPGLIWPSNGWHQAWYDDEQSLACKYGFVLEQELGGTGMWALGSDNGYAELWDLLEAYFTAPRTLGQGSRQQPIPVTAWPFEDAQDTSQGGTRYFNYYACNPDLPEYGREFVYQVDLCQPGTFHAEVESAPEHDPDLHLLTGLLEADCIDRGHLSIDRDLEPGRYYVVVDTYVEDAVELEGPYTLRMSFTPQPGTTGCAPDRVCEAGSCLCAAGTLDCEGTCVDPQTDPGHCGACGNACGPEQSCVDGTCTGGPNDAGAEASPADVVQEVPEPEPDVTVPQEAEPIDDGAVPNPVGPSTDEASGCSCEVRGGRAPWSGWALGLLLAALGWRRNRLGRGPSVRRS
jgi:MYXO-CTERM domain-containing protein